MKFTASVDFAAKIINFERFDYTTMDFIDFSNEMKREICKSFEPKKFRLVFDLTNVDPDGDGYSVHATASHRKQAKIGIDETEPGVFQLSAAAKISVPLKISGAKKEDFKVSIIFGDLWKGTENEVKLEITPFEITEFDLVT